MPMLDALLQAPVRVWELWLTHLWQATLVALILMAFACALRQAPARWRHGVYLLASLKLLLPVGLLLSVCGLSLATLPAALPASLLGLFDARTLATGLRQSLGWSLGWTAEVAPNLVMSTAGLAWLATGIWALGAGWLLARWRQRHRGLAEVVEQAEPVRRGVLAQRFRVLRRRVPGAESATLWVSSSLNEPGVWGVCQPRVIVPAAMPEHLDCGELDAVLLHELAHVGRRDNLVARLHYLLRALLWFHPLVWLLERRLLVERELACDEAVLTLAGAPQSYAQGLLKVLRFSLAPELQRAQLQRVPTASSALPVPVMSSMSGADLRLRMQRICAGQVPAARWSSRLVLASAAVVLVLSLLLPLHPSCALPWTPADQESEEVACHLDWQAQHTPAPCAGGVATLPPVITLLGG